MASSRLAGEGALAGFPRILKSYGWRILSLLIFFGAWEFAGRVPISIAFPTFIDTMHALFSMIMDGSMIKAFSNTLQPLIIGVTLSALFGVFCGVLMGLSKSFQWVCEPVFVVMQAAPMAALIPLVTFVYGIGLAAKIASVVILAAPIIVLNAFRAVRNANPSLIQMCKSFQGNDFQTIMKVIIPDASPMIFAGLRLGVAGGFIGVILAELLITPTGIGDLITYHRSVAEYAEMYAAIFSILLFSAITITLLEAAEITIFRPEKKEKS
jgi:ABC-type nitrate/sulfonate/bicarbonate transport system permease component